MAQESRVTRRLAGMLATRTGELGLESVEEPRKREPYWPMERLLAPVLVGIVAGCKSLADVELLTTNVSKACARLLEIRKRVPDTTMRDLLVRLDITDLRRKLWRQCKLALRRKALKPEGFPFGVATMDGRSTSTRLLDPDYAQTQHPEDREEYGLVRTITSALVSSAAKVCLDISPIPPPTNEMGHFKTAFEELCSIYAEEVFQVVTYDAGACSQENGRIVEQAHRAYLFGLKSSQPELYLEATRLLGNLGHQEAQATTTDVRGKELVRRRIWLTCEMAGWNGWKHLRTVIRVQSETTHEGGEPRYEERYFVSSLRIARLTPAQWLQLVRMHWGVENNNHWTYDAIFKEDKRPWIIAPKGMLVMMVLRRIAYNMLTLYRSVTQRSPQKRLVPWRTLINNVYIALLTALTKHTHRLRPRSSRALA